MPKTKSDAWLTLVNQDPVFSEPVLSHADSVLWHWLAAFNMHTPYMREHKLHPWANPKGKRVIEILRSLIYRCTPLRMGIWDERLFVAPPAWPHTMDPMKAFGLKEPPTPYEVACALLVAPVTTNFWGFRDIPLVARSVTFWWLAGMPEEGILGFLRDHPTTKGKGSATVIPGLLEKYFRHAMESRKFKIWALGSNPIPACASRLTARLVKEVLNGELKGAVQAPRPEKRAWDTFLAHPYIRSQFRTGIRRCAIPRKLYRPGVVWETVIDKLEWTREEGEVQKQLQTTTEWLERRVWRRPKWVRTLEFPREEESRVILGA